MIKSETRGGPHLKSETKTHFQIQAQDTAVQNPSVKTRDLEIPAHYFNASLNAL